MAAARCVDCGFVATYDVQTLARKGAVKEHCRKCGSTFLERTDEPCLPFKSPPPKSKPKKRHRFQPFSINPKDTEQDSKRHIYVCDCEDRNEAIRKASAVDPRRYHRAHAQHLPKSSYWEVILEYPPTGERNSRYHVDLLGLRETMV